MTPLQRYKQDIDELGFQEDEAQYMAVQALDTLYHELIEYQNAPELQPTRWQKCSARSLKSLSHHKASISGEESAEVRHT